MDSAGLVSDTLLECMNSTKYNVLDSGNVVVSNRIGLSILANRISYIYCSECARDSLSPNGTNAPTDI